MQNEPCDPGVQLLSDARRGRAEAAASFYRAYAPSMLAYARAMVRHELIAEDAVQQAFVQILSLKHGELEAVRDPLAWLIRATRNALLNMLRTESRMGARHRAWADTALSIGIPSAAKGDGPPKGFAELMTAVDTLPDEHRELILLKHVAGLTFDQIAWSLGQNRSTVATRYRSAIDKLRGTLHPAERTTHG